MNVGLQMIFQNYHGQWADEDVVAFELRTGELAESLGFDKIWPVEHHFTDYAACPDNTQFLSYLAARTERIKLATGAVILPWNDPLRVAEKIAFLDHLSKGRAVLGLGRGLARREYAGFNVDMSESRGRFDEAARMVLDALDTGFIEGAGPFYPRAKTAIRPRPLAGFRDRVYAVGMSPESVLQAAELGAHLMVFSQLPWEMFAEQTLPAYRGHYRKVHGRDAPPVLTVDLLVCHADPARAEALARQHMAAYYVEVMRHYEIMSEHFKQVRGYDHYAGAADVLKLMKLEDVAAAYTDVQTWGTPAAIVEKLRRRRTLLGDFELSVIVGYGGMPFDEAERSLRLFASDVIPALRAW
jgi:alkanesulfonate monooxygenase SsuD/methylene tetrahydromethanopterin reductase-like flavin-dependent oxidoreductase (luciferase family)